MEDGDHLANEGADADGRYPGRDASPNVAGAATAGQVPAQSSSFSAAGGHGVSSSQCGTKSTVTEAQKYLAAFDSPRYRLLDSIYGIRRGNRLANAARSDHLDQLS